MNDTDFSAVSSDMLAGNKPASAGEKPLAFTLPPTLEKTNLARRCIAAWSVEDTVFAVVRFDPGSRRWYIKDTVLDLLQDCIIFVCFGTTLPILFIQGHLSALDMLGSSLPNLMI
jgi:hypothetical protein